MPDHARRVYESMLEMLSDADNPTPLVRLNSTTGFEHAKVYAKLEWYNPFGSVKDRVAANLIRDAEERGHLEEAMKLVEATSGGTGMGLAMVSNLKGYGFIATLSDAIPIEKRTVLRFFGGEVVELDDALCPAPGAPEGAMQKAADMAAEPGHHQLNQYANPANPDAHYRTTGPEIWRQTNGEVTHFVAGLGTCGSITGTGRFLKSKNPGVKVLGVHPAEGHDIPGVRSIRQLEHTDFYKPDEYDAQTEIDNLEAYTLAARLNREESIIAGPSSGMALAGALKMVPDEEGVVAVVLFPDNIFKYTTSVRKHLPTLFPAPKARGRDSAGPSEEERTLRQMIEHARRSESVVDMGVIEDLMFEDPPPVFVDVRTREEFADGSIENAVNIPLDELSEQSEGLPEDRGSTIVTVCNVGRISLTAMLLLKSMGFSDVRNLMGGLNAYVAEGNPLV